MQFRLARFAVLFGLAAAFAGLLPVIANAAVTAPVLTPAPIVLEDFESASSANYTVARWDLLNPSTAWWGRKSASGSYRNGLYGLWCAGTQGTWPSYPDGSAGFATFPVPQSADYYALYVDFWYRMPSLGAADGDSFVVGWYTSALSDYPKTVYGFPKTGSWTREVLDISQPVNPTSHDRGGNLSRSSGSVRLQWVDSAEGPTQSPPTGAGPSVDDFAVTGWKYGPVRSAQSQTSPGQVLLTWQRPYAATSGTTLEGRSIGYRVFRTPRDASSWTQLTPALIQDNGTTATFADTTVAGATAYTYAVQAFDASDASGMPTMLDVVSHDTVPPTTSASGIPAGWSTTNVSVTLAGVDQVYGAGVAATYYKLNGGGQLTYSGSPFAVSVEGTNTIEYWSVDRAVPANTELPHKTATVKIDKLPPSTPGQPDASSITQTSVSLSWAASTDVASGVKGYDVYDGATKVVNQTSGTSATIGGLAPGSTHSYTVRAVDNVNWVSSASPARSVTTLPDGGGDTTPPVTTALVTPSGWTTSTVTVTLTRNEAGTTYYKLNGGGQVTYGGAFAVDTVGTTLIEYWSVDTAGNPESSKSAYAYIDRAAPSTQIQGIPPTEWSTADVLVNFQVTDALDPAPVTYYKLDGGVPKTGAPAPISTAGPHTIEYWSQDAAGNVETPHKNATVKIDKTAPATPGQPTATATSNSASLSWVASSDPAPGSGVKLYRVYRGGVKIAEVATTSFTDSGLNPSTTYSYTVSAVDNAGLESALSPARQVTTSAAGGGGGGGGGGGTPPDTTPPATTVSGVPASWTNINVTVTLARSEPGAAYYRLGSGSQISYSGSFAVSAEGVTALEYWSVDSAGNVESHKTATIQIDKSAPGLTTDAKASYEAIAVVNVSAADVRSGVRSVEYRLDGGAWVASARVTTTLLGSHSLDYRATDFAGNVANRSVTFVVSAPPGPAVTTIPVAFSGTTATTVGSAYPRGYVTIAGTLGSVGTTTSLPGQKVYLLVSYNGSTFTTSTASVTEVAPGKYSVRVLNSRPTWYRLRFPGTSGYLASVSGTLKALPKASLTTPVAPSVMSRTRTYSVYGYLKPRHTGKSVRILAYRYEKVGGRYVWKLRVTAYASTSNYSTYSKYTARMRLPYAGKWRIRAYHGDAGHYPTYSGTRSVTVR